MTRDWKSPFALLLAVAVGSGGRVVRAQQSAAGGGDSLQLGTLLRNAMAHDPRQRQFGLLARQTDLRLTNLAVQWLPSINGEAQATYQSTVFSAPPGVPFPLPSRDMYDSRLTLNQALLDPTIGPKRATERARLAESEAQVRTTLFGLRQEVNDAFFTVALLENRIGIITVTITDLERQLRETVERVRAGAALPGDTAAVRATLTQRRQDQVELHASREAALARLSDLIGRTVGAGDVMVLPELGDQVAQARGGLADLRSRPEYAAFARTRDRLAREEGEVSAAQWPVFSAFATVGRGRPGLNPISNRFDNYLLAGVKLSWAPWNWGSHGRERQTLSLQREIVAADEAAFARSLTRSIQEDLTTIDRMDSTLGMDDQIIALREQVESETRRRFQESVVTASEYLDRSTDVLEARLARATHRVELAQARARLLTTLGLEIP